MEPNDTHSRRTGELRLQIDDTVLLRARTRRRRRGHHLDDEVSEFLEDYASADLRRNAIRRFLEIARSHDASGQATERTWRRDDIYDGREPSA